MGHDLYEAVLKRRSVYTIADKITVTDDKLEEIIKYAVKHTPSPFNMQSQRAVVLFGPHHKKLWDIVMQTLKKTVPPEKFAPTEEKIKSFAAGHATVLYYTDGETVAKMQAQFPSYKDNFVLWAQQCMGMLQYLVWTELASEGIGSSLQHYNPLIDEEVRKTFDVPAAWQLSAQMPLGVSPREPGPKNFLPVEQRVKILR
jgi:predicted oxidoreductase (fatty acid repression mutant protein)